MRTNDCISHFGIIEEVKEHSVIVNIVSQSACSMCHSKGSCSTADFAEKQYEISNTDSTIKAGDQVMVKMHKSLGPKAVVLSYGLPFIVFLATLITVVQISGSEALAGISSLILLAVYFSGLWLFREKLNAAFSFEIEKLA